MLKISEQIVQQNLENVFPLLWPPTWTLIFCPLLLTVLSLHTLLLLLFTLGCWPDSCCAAQASAEAAAQSRIYSVSLWKHQINEKFPLWGQKPERGKYLSWMSSTSFLSICSLSTRLAFSRHNTRSRSWFSRTRRASRDFLAARLFFLQYFFPYIFSPIFPVFTHLRRSQYLSSFLTPGPGDARPVSWCPPWWAWPVSLVTM